VDRHLLFLVPGLNSYFYVMRWVNNKIGFDDRLVMVFGITLLSFVVPIVFFGWRIGRAPQLSWLSYWPSLTVTAAIWLGSRYILIWARTRYANFGQVKKRMWVQMSVIIAYVLVVNNVLGALLFEDCERVMRDAGRTLTPQDVLIDSNAASILCTFLVIAIYESIYFVNELRKSVEEKELLKRESLQAQLSALKTQVNPHFLFNNLNTLSAVIPDNPGQAIDFVQQLSKVYRHILEVRDEQSIVLKEELEVLEAYAFLLKTRFGENLNISIRVTDENLQQRVVPLSLQILMENAIKHNIVSAAKPLKIDVYAGREQLVVSNTLQKKNQLVESTGIGLDNIRNRYRLLSDRKVEVEEGPDSFTVRIPLIAVK
jgi:two-component system, LytTR family, sensor kinase